MITFEDIKNNKTVQTYILEADKALNALGYTEHSFAHVTKVALTAGDILEKLGFSKKEIELAKIAGYLHDIGNLVNRADHSQSGAVMAFRILDNLNMDATDIAKIISAIGNHDEGTGVPVDKISAAIILADKSDVRRSRVRNTDRSTFDIHDRVNYSVEHSSLEINPDKTMIISPDEGGMGKCMYYSSVMGIDLGMFYKRRDFSKIVDGRNPIVSHEFLGSDVEGKDVIVVDDMISSGDSMLDVCRQLKKLKACHQRCSCLRICWPLPGPVPV